MGSDADSVNEAKAFEENKDQIVQTEGEKVMAASAAEEEAQAPGARVYDDVLTQAVAAGYTPYEAKRYATDNDVTAPKHNQNSQTPEGKAWSKKVGD